MASPMMTTLHGRTIQVDLSVLSANLEGALLTPSSDGALCGGGHGEW